MAAAADAAVTGQKRGPGRPPKSSMPASKKQKTAVHTPSAATQEETPVVASSIVNSPIPEKKQSRLASKLSDDKPLPVLAEPQSASLSNDEYRSIASSAVLAASLEQSRLRWISSGVFERYWVKPEGGKNAKPAPPNNPDPKWMKSRGECRIRIEPHLFVADMYVEDRGKVQNAAQKQPITQYRPTQQYGQQQLQNRNLLPVLLPPATSQNGGNTMQKTQATQRPQSQASRAPLATSSTPADPSALPQAQKPDPVISMLATRASNDPQLKALMKEVATGYATQDQLKVFQKHIDELTAIISKQKQADEDSAARAAQQANTIQYDASSNAQSPGPSDAAQQNHPLRPPAAPVVQTPQPQYVPQQTWAPPVPASANLPVVLAFKDAGATEDRFLFPQHSILESLSPQHLLVSFIVKRNGRQAVDPTFLDLDTDYWQPLTIMIEVAYGREELLNCIRRWVKPAEEVRKHMEEIMQSCQRIPDCYLALRLPFKSTAPVESGEVSKEATPVLEDRSRPRASTKAAKKAVNAAKAETATTRRSSGSVMAAEAGKGQSNATAPVGDAVESAPVAQGAPSTPATDNDEGNGRVRRTTRKSVRISEG